MNRLREVREEKKLDNKGFSLVELIIVIAIMAVLIGVLAPQYMKYVERSRESADLDSIDSMFSAMTIYLADPNNATAVASLTELPTLVGDSLGGVRATPSDALTDAGMASAPALKSKKYGKTTWTITFNDDGSISFSTGDAGDALKTAMGY